MRCGASCVCDAITNDRQVQGLQADEGKTVELRAREQYRRIGCNIAYYRRLKGYTQVQLAQELGITANYLSQIECGRRNKYSLHTLIMASEVLEVPLNSLCD